MSAAKRFELNILKGGVVSDKTSIDPPLNNVTMPNSDLLIEVHRELVKSRDKARVRRLKAKVWKMVRSSDATKL